MIVSSIVNKLLDCNSMIEFQTFQENATGIVTNYYKLVIWNMLNIYFSVCSFVELKIMC